MFFDIGIPRISTLLAGPGRAIIKHEYVETGPPVHQPAAVGPQIPLFPPWPVPDDAILLGPGALPLRCGGGALEQLGMRGAGGGGDVRQLTSGRSFHQLLATPTDRRPAGSLSCRPVQT